MKKTTFFKWSDGDVRWTPLLFMIIIPTIVGVLLLGRHIAFGFTDQFWRRGLLTILCFGIATVLGIFIDRKYSAPASNSNPGPLMFMVLVFYYTGLLGPYVGLKIDRTEGIPDESVYYANGKVRNYTNSDKKNFYFKTYRVSSRDSLYILEYGEEPGYNWNWRSVVDNGLAPKSTAPRSDEYSWRKPLPVETLKIKDP